MGVLRNKPLKLEDQFPVVDDLKLKMTIASVADKFNENIREMIYRAYTDDELARIYRAIRASGIYQHGGKSKVHRKILEFPNAYIYDFVDTVMTSLYDRDWMKKKKALRHELVRPWWVVNRL